MKSNEMITNEVLLKANILQAKKKINKIRINCTCMLVFILSSLTTTFRMIEIESLHQLDSQLAYGTIIYLNDNTGAYATIGVIMFVLGMALTILCVRVSFIETLKKWVTHLI